ncbi:hypothetical protein D3C81_1576650 [compost metagenome]
MKVASRLPRPRCSVSSSGVPLASTRPACISEMRSQRCASFMKWVEMKMVTPSLRDSSTISAQKPSRATGSTPEVGSSRMRISGLWITATASDRRWRIPSGRLPGSSSRAVSRSKRWSISATRGPMLSVGRWNSRACSSRFCSTVSSLYSENAWDM